MTLHHVSFKLSSDPHGQVKEGYFLTERELHEAVKKALTSEKEYYAWAEKERGEKPPAKGVFLKDLEQSKSDYTPTEIVETLNNSICGYGYEW